MQFLLARPVCVIENRPTQYCIGHHGFCCLLIAATDQQTISCCRWVQKANRFNWTVTKRTSPGCPPAAVTFSTESRSQADFGIVPAAIVCDIDADLLMRIVLWAFKLLAWSLSWLCIALDQLTYDAAKMYIIENSDCEWMNTIYMAL